MKKCFKDTSSKGAPKAKATVAELIRKLELRLDARLDAMDKKLDALINQPQRRPFERGNSQNAPRRFSHPGRHDGGRRNSAPGEKTFTKAVCADCSKECQIPFKPSGGRPVYCQDCFAKRRDSRLYIAKPYEGPVRNDLPRQGSFENKHNKKRHKPAVENKPFYARRKKR